MSLPVRRLASPAAGRCLIVGLIAVCATLLAGCVNDSGHLSATGAATADSREAAAGDYLALALAYYEAGDLDAARRQLDIAGRHLSGQPRWRHAAALIAAAEGRPETAERHFRRALRLDADNAAIHNNFGVLLHRLGRDGEAEEQFRLALAYPAYPGRAWAWENLGRSLLRRQQFTEAARAFAAALEINRELPVAALELSLLHRRAGEIAAARRVFGEYLRIAGEQRLEHGPKALFAGAEFAWRDGNRKQVEEFGAILGTLYPETAEYQAYRDLIDGD